MKKYDGYFEKERMLYVVAVVKGDTVEAALHMGIMLGYKDALSNTGVDFAKICYLHDRLMTAIEFGYNMRRYSKTHYVEGDNE